MSYSNDNSEKNALYPNLFLKMLSSSQLKNTPIELDSLETSAGNLSFIRTNACSEYTLVFIHGNSSSSAAFLKQLKHFGSKYNIYSFDLPGHGLSDNAKNPETTYTFSGYAEIISQALRILGLKKIILIGWSLGGHVALELVQKCSKNISGLIITGTPPIHHSSVGIQAGFLINKDSFKKNLAAYGKPFTDEEVEKFLINSSIQTGEIEIFRKAALRTHPVARSIMFDAILQAKEIKDERVHLPELLIPLGVIMNIKDKLINLNYIQSLSYNPRTFMGFSYINDGHASFWEKTDEFNKILEGYIINIISKCTGSYKLLRQNQS